MSDPVYENVRLTDYESYELAEITAELDRVNRMHEAAQRRLDNLARAVLKDYKMDDMSAWSFHIDAKGKRVVIRREVTPPPVATEEGDQDGESELRSVD
jgi:hypothetical protein